MVSITLEEARATFNSKGLKKRVLEYSFGGLVEGLVASGIQKKGFTNGRGRSKFK